MICPHIDHLSADLRDAFPDMKGFSSRNLKYMKVFAQECPDFLIGQQSAAQLPWFHIVTILTKLADPALRDWYARGAPWTLPTLVDHLRSTTPVRTLCCFPGDPPMNLRSLACLLVILLTLGVLG